jgi:DNA repair exonuclease SbcCD ATPase subunit
MDSGDLSPKVESSPRHSDGDETPQFLTRSQRSVSSSSLFKESASIPEEFNGLHREDCDEEPNVAMELEAAKSLLEMYKQRSGGLIHAIEDMRNQLMALQNENATLKIENEELKRLNEAFVKENQARTQLDGNSGPTYHAEQNPTNH